MIISSFLKIKIWWNFYKSKCICIWMPVFSLFEDKFFEVIFFLSIFKHLEVCISIKGPKRNVLIFKEA